MQAAGGRKGINNHQIPDDDTINYNTYLLGKMCSSRQQWHSCEGATTHSEYSFQACPPRGNPGLVL